jgi:hypothetical protein
MCGEFKGCSGQCVDEIIPTNNKQKQIIKIWKTYHLNGMSAGTLKQDKKIKQMKCKYDYEKVCRFLSSFYKDGTPITAFELDELNDQKNKITQEISDLQKEISLLNKKQKQMNDDNLRTSSWIVIKDLNIKHFATHRFNGVSVYLNHQISKRNIEIDKFNKLIEQENEKTMLYDIGRDGKLYQYGSTWHRIDLPEDLWEQILKLKSDIETIEETKKNKGGSWEDITDYKMVALGKYLNLEPKETESDISADDDEMYSYCGVEYYVLTEEEAYDRAKDYLEDEQWKVAVENGNTELGKNEWVEWVIEEDGYGKILNSYDGTMFYDDELELYIMRV